MFKVYLPLVPIHDGPQVELSLYIKSLLVHMHKSGFTVESGVLIGVPCAIQVAESSQANNVGERYKLALHSIHKVLSIGWGVAQFVTVVSF